MAITATGRAFDLGKGSIGEAFGSGNEFLHKALLMSGKLAQKNRGLDRF